MKRMAFAMSMLVCLLCVAGAEDWNRQTAQYAPVLELWRAGLSRDENAWLADESIEDAMRTVWNSSGLDPLEAVGYTYLDLDGDGSPELIIGVPEEFDFFGSNVYEILTLEDGSPVSVLRGWERNRLSIAYDERTGRYGYYREGSSGASNSVFEYCLPGWRDTQTVEANDDFDTGRTIWTLNGAEIGEAKAQALIASWQERLLRPALTPFTEEVSRRDTGFVDEGTPDAAGAYCRSYRITPEGPTVDLVIADTGRRNAPEARHGNVLSAEITIRETGQTQRFDYDGTETPATDSMSCLAWLQDINFDGYGDLMLCTARGASNEFSIFCLWDPETGCFDPPMTHCAFDLETERASAQVTPLELVNFTLQKSGDGGGYVISHDQDGAACYTQLVYRWEENGRVLELTQVHDVSSVDRSLIRDRVFLFLSQGEKAWDHVYPEEWYYGATEPYRVFQAAADALWQGGDRVWQHVDNVDWVNLRERDSKQSPSLAHLDRYTSVQVLKENCADGWTLVLWDTGEPQAEWFGNRTEIGFIWHSYLSE